MAYSEPVILKECFPLDDSQEMIEPILQDVANSWIHLRAELGNLPTWSMDFALLNPNAVSRMMLYDTSGDDIYITLIGDQCREFIGLEKTKGPLAELMPEINAKDIRNRIALCKEQRAPNYCLKSMSWNNDRDFIKYEALFLPFVAKDTKECTWFLVTMAFHIREHPEQ